MKNILIAFLLWFPMFVFAQAAAYDKSNHQVTYGDYEINYSVFNSTFLTPEVASAYKIIRSPKTALVNISVVKKHKDGRRTGETAKINGTEFDLIIKKNLKFRLIQEKNAVYYLAEIDIQNKIPVYFSIQIQPDVTRSPYKLDFKKVLYVQ